MEAFFLNTWVRWWFLLGRNSWCEWVTTRALPVILIVPCSHCVLMLTIIWLNHLIFRDTLFNILNIIAQLLQIRLYTANFFLLLARIGVPFFIWLFLLFAALWVIFWASAVSTTFYLVILSGQILLIRLYLIVVYNVPSLLDWLITLFFLICGQVKVLGGLLKVAVVGLIQLVSWIIQRLINTILSINYLRFPFF